MNNILDNMTMISGMDFLLEYNKLNEKRHLLQTKFNYYISVLVLLVVIFPMNMIIEVKLTILIPLSILFIWNYGDYLNCRSKVEKMEKELYKNLQESKNGNS